MSSVSTASKHRLSALDYHKMNDARIFQENDRIELIEGELIDMAPIGSFHADCIDRLNHLFVTQSGSRYRVRIQNPLQLGDYSEPQPDIVIVNKRSYRSAHPGPEDVLLLIEAADSSLSYDRDTKVPIYANHGIVEVWLIDLQAKNVQVYRKPVNDKYLSIVANVSGTLSPESMPGIVVNLTDLWADS